MLKTWGISSLAMIAAMVFGDTVLWCAAYALSISGHGYFSFKVKIIFNILCIKVAGNDYLI